MAGDRRPPSWLAWVLCWLSLGCLLTGAFLRIAFPEDPEDGVFFTLISVPGFALVPLVGALIAARLPTNPYGWVWCALGLAFGVQAISEGLRRAGVVANWFAGTLIGAGFMAGLCLLVFVLLLFPTGRLPGPLWRWLALAAVAVAGTVILLGPFTPSAPRGAEPTPWALGGTAGVLLADFVRGAVPVMYLIALPAAASLFLRFRRGGALERQQLKWVLLVAVIGGLTTPLDLLDVPLNPQVWAVVDGGAIGLFPLAVGFAVLRYRLFEIDRIVSRTVSYGLLTAGLVGLYLVLVTLLRSLLEPLAGSSTLAVAASTLAVAAAFNPVRRRLQAAVDRRFDRARYDAGRAVEAFAARLRDEVDLDEVTAGLRDTVVATVAPARVSVWLRLPSRPDGA